MSESCARPSLLEQLRQLRTAGSVLAAPSPPVIDPLAATGTTLGLDASIAATDLSLTRIEADMIAEASDAELAAACAALDAGAEEPEATALQDERVRRGL